MTLTQFKEIVSAYNGNIIETNNSCEIVSNNRIKTYYADGSICDKIVKCTIGIKDGSLYGEEGSCELLGGFGYPKDYATEESVIRQLERYRFTKKRERQMTIFDL